MPPDSWQTFSAPELGLQFQYPIHTPTGHPVDLHDFRVHFRSHTSNELYVELAQYLHATAQEVYERERDFVVSRLEGGAVSALLERTFAARPASTYSITFAGGERTVILIEQADTVYRVLYDSRSELSAQMITTVSLIER